MEGEIYYIKNIINGSGYVGQALKTVSSDKIKWGTYGRWKSHVWEAFSSKNKGCIILNNAIIKYGVENFEIIKICDCRVEDMDNLEKKYIVEFNTLSPNGYNLTAGGKNGKHSEETNLKKKIPKCDNTEYNKLISFVNIGKRLPKQPRKHPEDNDLPKYICAKRIKGIVIGYQVLKFPIGVNTYETITRLFKSKNDPSIGLTKAKEHLAELQHKYSHIEDDNKAKKDEIRKSKLLIKKQKAHKGFPTNIYPILARDGKIDGYCVKGLRDNFNQDIPERSFTYNNNQWNLDQAVKFITQVKSLLVNNPAERNWVLTEIKRRPKTFDLPSHINYVYYSGKVTGYRVHIKYRNIDQKVVYHSKNYSKQSQTMEEKFKLACNYLNEFIHTHT